MSKTLDNALREIVGTASQIGANLYSTDEEFVALVRDHLPGSEPDQDPA
tara:strand:+ start:124 stop:270 length:147 start_codon:yes stop_codon:yes gene_type:complete